MFSAKNGYWGAVRVGQAAKSSFLGKGSFDKEAKKKKKIRTRSIPTLYDPATGEWYQDPYYPYNAGSQDVAKDPKGRSSAGRRHSEVPFSPSAQFYDNPSYVSDSALSKRRATISNPTGGADYPRHHSRSSSAATVNWNTRKKDTPISALSSSVKNVINKRKLPGRTRRVSETGSSCSATPDRKRSSSMSGLPNTNSRPSFIDDDENSAKTPARRDVFDEFAAGHQYSPAEYDTADDMSLFSITMAARARKDLPGNDLQSSGYSRRGRDHAAPAYKDILAVHEKHKH